MWESQCIYVFGAEWHNTWGAQHSASYIVVLVSAVIETCQRVSVTKKCQRNWERRSSSWEMWKTVLVKIREKMMSNLRIQEKSRERGDSLTQFPGWVIWPGSTLQVHFSLPSISEHLRDSRIHCHCLSHSHKAVKGKWADEKGSILH